MKTYKLGSKLDCIIRSFAPGKIGAQEMTYGNQPYTTLKNIEASLSFTDSSVQSKTTFTKLAYNVDTLREVTVSDVELNDKILNLIFSKSEAKLCSSMQNCDAEDNKIYITAPTDKIYQVFIYDVDGNLEQAFGELDNFEVNVLRNENYIVFFSYEGENTYSLSKTNSFYLTLDLHCNAEFQHWQDVKSPDFFIMYIKKTDTGAGVSSNLLYTKSCVND